MTLTAVLGGLALSGAAGLNPWVALLFTGLLDRAGWVDLASPWGWLGSAGLLVVVAVVLVGGFARARLWPGEARRAGGERWSLAGALGRRGAVVDWIAVVAAGAIVFDAHAGAHVALLVSLGLGAVSSAVLHGARAAARAAGRSSGDGEARATSFAAGPMSMLEDVAAALLVLVAFSFPAFAGVVAIALAAGAGLTARRS